MSDLSLRLKPIEEAMDAYMASHRYVETAFGPAFTASGYEWSEVRFSEKFVSIKVYMLDRKIRKHDKYTREGDSVYFIYDQTRGMIQTQEEREAKLAELEQ